MHACTHLHNLYATACLENGVAYWVRPASPASSELLVVAIVVVVVVRLVAVVVVAVAIVVVGEAGVVVVKGPVTRLLSIHPITK